MILENDPSWASRRCRTNTEYGRFGVSVHHSGHPGACNQKRLQAYSRIREMLSGMTKPYQSFQHYVVSTMQGRMAVQKEATGMPQCG